ncbi:Os08g0448050, partial [Oryza sativa Japonica Group]
YLSEDGVGELGVDDVLKLLAHGGGAGDDHADGGEVVAVEGVALGHLDDDGRDERRDGDAVALHQLQHLDGVEPLHDHDGGAGAHPAEEDGVEGVDVEHGEHAEHHVVLPEVEVRVLAVDELRHAGHQPAVRQHHPLGEPRRARRVGQRHGVVGDVDGDLRQRRAVGGGEARERRAPLGAAPGGDDGHAREAAHLGDERRLGDHHRRAGRRHLLGDLRRGVQRVGRGGDRPEP